MGDRPLVVVVGGGLAGVECAWAAANRGAQVLLYEMRPTKLTPAHHTGDLAELVCSNSLKSSRLGNASGLLKEEMRRLGSVTLSVADTTAVPAGEALAVDPSLFAAGVTERIHAHTEITVVREEVLELPNQRPTVLATGPLTSTDLALSLQQLTGREALYFYDAVAPTVTADSIAMERVYRASRRGRGGTVGATSEDYLNCPMTKEEYQAFYQALIQAAQSTPHLPEEHNTTFFEGCLPIEELARRGPGTLLYGPMRPIGLPDPRTGRRPYAVVQLRQENKSGTLWGLVGFQTRLKWSEQQRVFRMIPGLEAAQFVRYGVLHRNTYLRSPEVLAPDLQVKAEPGIFVAGQLSGVEGYMESAAMGILAGINAARLAQGLPTVLPPAETMLGSLCRYLVECLPDRFAPMNANHGLLPPLTERAKDRKARGDLYAQRSLAALQTWIRSELGEDRT